MPPKKVQEPERKPLIGRVGTNLKVGIVGVPNVGKSTFFNVLTKTRRVPVPDDRFDFLCNYFKPVSKVPAFLNIVDIAGLVKGASEGQGLGNAFLSHISACDAIFHLCRTFEDTNVTHVEGEVDPIRDLEIIGEELRLKDEEQLMKHLEKLERTVVRGNDKKQKPEYDALCKIKAVLVDQKQHIRFADWATNDVRISSLSIFRTSFFISKWNPYFFITSIPRITSSVIETKYWQAVIEKNFYVIQFLGQQNLAFREVVRLVKELQYLQNFDEKEITLLKYVSLEMRYFNNLIQLKEIKKEREVWEFLNKERRRDKRRGGLTDIKVWLDYCIERLEGTIEGPGQVILQGVNTIQEGGR
ncbi:hypothetical protein RN001_011637 [Aquatica leii]|uniref:OBG-type G domain-containing protein n=1 Tax=Aquatica leii TaxID=1421715 RepID=A0AAN7NXK9_9COLE|nr:hypothetical protein RN001_011637 [Aquatica leii]